MGNSVLTLMTDIIKQRVL